MSTTNVDQLIDNHRWLMNHGLSTDSMKNQLFFLGSIVHKNIQALEVLIFNEKKTVQYKLYVDNELLQLVNDFNKFKNSDSFFDLWRLRRIVKKHGSLDFEKVLDKCIKEYCGPYWKVSVTIDSITNYVENSEEFSENANTD